MFAASPDHRIAPPLSYVELLQYSEQAPGGSNASAGVSASNSSGRGVGNGRGGGATGSTGSMSRCGMKKTELQEENGLVVKNDFSCTMFGCCMGLALFAPVKEIRRPFCPGS